MVSLDFRAFVDMSGMTGALIDRLADLVSVPKEFDLCRASLDQLAIRVLESIDDLALHVVR